MKIMLIDIDSKIPNLALMKLSAFHKSRGDRISLIKMKKGILPISAFDFSPDIVFVSCVFPKNKKLTNTINKMFPYSFVIKGGYGINNSQLSSEIEHIMPDYELYGIDYSIGFCSRGCFRNCPWCIVPKMEGKLRDNCMIQEFHNPDHKKVVLLDNNFLASFSFKQNMNYLLEQNLKVSYNQGLDIRLINEKNVKLIAESKYYDFHFKERRLYFAWDSLEIEPTVMKGIKILKEQGIKMKDLMFYILCGFNTTHEQDYHRIKALMNLGCKPFVMKYNGMRNDKWLNRLAKWVNRRYYKVCEFEDFNMNTDKFRNK